MTTHIMSFTYAPKIEGVRNGPIRQTIRKWRKNRTIRPGDYILFHGWKGRPYRSKWSWRKKVRVMEVWPYWFDEGRVVPQDAKIEEDGYLPVWRWNDPRVDELAKRDGIEPPYGEDLREALKSLNGKDWEGYYDVIRWEGLTEEDKIMLGVVREKHERSW